MFARSNIDMLKRISVMVLFAGCGGVVPALLRKFDVLGGNLRMFGK